MQRLTPRFIEVRKYSVELGLTVLIYLPLVDGLNFS